MIARARGHMQVTLTSSTAIRRRASGRTRSNYLISSEAGNTRTVGIPAGRRSQPVIGDLLDGGQIPDIDAAVQARRVPFDVGEGDFLAERFQGGDGASGMRHV